MDIDVVFVVQTLRLVKENKMKVKAKDAGLVWITPRKEYCVIEKMGSGGFQQYLVTQDNGINAWFHHSHFTVIEEQEPEIAVGSEWVSAGGDSFTVKYVGDYNVFIKWHGNGFESYRSIVRLGTDYKPKPKTVTMYFYKDKCGLHARELDFGDSLFTREIEL